MLNSLSLRSLVLVGVSLLFSVATSAQDLSTNQAAKLLPNKLGDFRAAGPARSIPSDLIENNEQKVVTSLAVRSYVLPTGARLSVTLVTTSSDSGAYAVLTRSRRTAEDSVNQSGTNDESIGTAGFSFWDGTYNNLHFFKGRVYVSIKEEGKSTGAKPLTDFAKPLAETLDRSEGEIPVLVKHLPDWEKAGHHALYVISVETLRDHFGEESVFKVVDFGGGAQGAVAKYGQAELVLIEFNTPQLATDNDQRIVTRIQELRSAGTTAPSAYRRVGNYAVFVFGAANEQAADQLIDQVKYQQVVQWLGTDPNLYERYEKAQREFLETTYGVFVAVVKGSGLALITCFAVGGLFGALLFRRRRAQQRAAEAYSDAGGMLRLNLDEITPQTDPSRLVGPGN